MHLNLLNAGGGAETEVWTLIGTGGKGAAGDDIGSLPEAVRRDVHGCADTVARTLRTAGELEGDPVIALPGHVAQQCRRGVKIVDDDVDATVVEEIAEGHAAAGRQLGKTGAFDGRNELELPFHVVDEEWPLLPGGAPGLLIHDRVDVAV